MRARVTLALAAVLAVGCKDSKPPQERPEARQPLQRPGAKAPAIDDPYGKAKHVAFGVLAPRAHTADAILVFARDWTKASPPLRTLGRDARSGEVTALIVAGAASREGRVPAGAAEPWASVGAVAVAVAAERDLAGQSVDAAWDLLAAVRMGYDITLGRPPPEAKHGLNLVDGALAALQSVVQRASVDALPTADLAPVLAACRALMRNAPTEPAPAPADKGEGGKWTDGEWTYRYRRASAGLSATCFIIAHTMERRGARPAGDRIVDPVSGAPWQIVDGVIRGGELEHQGARERIEFPLLEPRP